MAPMLVKARDAQFKDQETQAKTQFTTVNTMKIAEDQGFKVVLHQLKKAKGEV